MALTRLAPRAAEAVPALLETLDRPDSKAGLEAIVALGAIGSAAKPALRRLNELETTDSAARTRESPIR